MSDQAYAKLRIEGMGDTPVSDIEQYLADLRKAYCGLVVFETLTDSAIERINLLLKSGRGIHEPPVASVWSQTLWRVSSDRFHPADLVRPDQVLTLKAVRLESPGFWEFVGKLNPLETIRQFLNDMHERRKDREYREAAEQRRLYLQNLELENKVIEHRLKIIRSLGATDADLTPLMNQMVVDPLKRLATHQESGLIITADIAALQSNAKKDAPVVVAR